MTDDFSNYPISLGELRSQVSQSPSKWSPREILIDVLRRIDNKQLNPDVLFVAMGSAPDQVDYVTSGQNNLRIIGCVEQAKLMFMSGEPHD